MCILLETPPNLKEMEVMFLIQILFKEIASLLLFASILVTKRREVVSTLWPSIFFVQSYGESNQ